MVFRDQRLVCKQCAKTFFFTVTEQRRLAGEPGEKEITSPELCPECRPESRPSPVRQVRPRPETRPVIESQSPPEIVNEFPLEVDGVKVKLIGEIKWYRPEKGYGFITKADGRDIFFHRTSVVGGTLQLREGARVEFQVRQTPKGAEAFNVSILPPA